MLIERESNHVVHKSLPILRITPQHPIELTLQLGAPVWFRVHWVGRQLMCAGDNCPACSSVPAREQGFMPCTITHKGKARPILLELSRNAWERAISFAAANNLKLSPGTKIMATRKSRKTSLTLEALADAGKVTSFLGNRKLVISCVAVIHGLAPMNDSEEIQDWADRVRDQRTYLLKKAMQ